MCLTVDKKKTKLYDGVKNKTYTFYKVFDYCTNEYLVSPYQCFKIYQHGIYECRDDLDVDIFLLEGFIEPIKQIYGGCFYAYIIGGIIDKDFYRRIIMPIQVKSEDIIAAGINNDICFFKYEILKKDWDNIFNKKFCLCCTTTS
jgi:hypothetical protein